MSFPSRFTLHDQPPALPGVCFICKSVNDAPFLDTGISVPFEGVIYIGANCLREMHAQIEPVDTVLQSQLVALKNRVTDYIQTEVGRAYALVGDVLNDTRTRLGHNIDGLVPDLHSFEPATVENDENLFPDDDTDDDGDDEINVEGDSTPVVEGPDDLSSDSDDGQLDPRDEDRNDTL